MIKVQFTKGGVQIGLAYAAGEIAYLPKTQAEVLSEDGFVIILHEEPEKAVIDNSKAEKRKK